MNTNKNLRPIPRSRREFEAQQRVGFVPGTEYRECYECGAHGGHYGYCDKTK